MRIIVESLLALLALLLCLPLMALIALAVMIDSPGSPFHVARRIGKGGQPFRMWKFRTMITGAARRGPPITGNNDPRVTRAGRFLRRSKLDELPQLLNVLLGDMVVVGPRPETPEIVGLYTADQRAILAVKPGLTGFVQVAIGDEPSLIPAGVEADRYYVENLLERKLRQDLEYLKTRTLLTDLKVIFATALLVLRALVPGNFLITTRKTVSED